MPVSYILPPVFVVIEVSDSRQIKGEIICDASAYLQYGTQTFSMILKGSLIDMS